MSEFYIYSGVIGLILIAAVSGAVAFWYRSRPYSYEGEAPSPLEVFATILFHSAILFIVGCVLAVAIALIFAAVVWALSGNWPQWWFLSTQYLLSPFYIAVAMLVIGIAMKK